MKTFAHSHAPRYLKARATAREREAMRELDHETEVIRGVVLAAPLALLLWVPLIALAVHFL